jgi:uncharacterized BrkB/YihY/UPF0761 family membrane protein
MIIDIALGIVLGVVLLYALRIALAAVVVILSLSRKERGEWFNRMTGSQRFWRWTMTIIIAAFILVALLNSLPRH